VNFAIKQPAVHSINQIGNDDCKGAVERRAMSASVIIETCDNINDTQRRAQDYRNDFVARGHATLDNESEFWSGSASKGQAWIHVDTTELHVMAFYY
jgi:hypothetical protein